MIILIGDMKIIQVNCFLNFDSRRAYNDVIIGGNGKEA
jgi:hypothetical protein